MSTDEIRAAIGKAGSDGASYGFAYGGYRISQHIDELTRFIDFISERAPTSYLEIGAGSFGTGRLICELVPSIKTAAYITLDDHPAFGELAKNVEALKGAGVKVYGVLKGAESTEALTMATEFAPWDVIFEDPPWDEERDGYGDDIRAYAPLLAEGGVMAFHDTNDAIQGHTPKKSPRIREQCEAAGLTFADSAKLAPKNIGTDWYVKETA